MSLATKEERLSPSSDPCVFFPLAADPAELDTRFGEMPQLRKNSRLGFARKHLAPHQGNTWTNSASALGIREVLLQSGVRSRCTDKERDFETGLDNFGARFNSSSFGRFMSPDPDNESGFDNQDDPQSWNAYSYVRNSPLNLTDPDGRDYKVCIDNGNGGQNCTIYNNDADFVKAATASGVALSGDPEGSGNIYATVDGEQVQIGTFQHFGSPRTEGAGVPDISADYFFNFPALFSGVKGAFGLVKGVFNLGRAAGAFELTTIGSGTKLAAAAAEAAEVSNVVTKAAAAVGNQDVIVSSKEAAAAAAKEFLGPGAEPITDRVTGAFSGWKNGDRVVIDTHADQVGEHMNFINKATGGNLHVRW